MPILSKIKSIFSALMSWILMKNANGKPTNIITTARDITERKKAEETLWEAKAYSDSLIDAIKDGFFVMDNHGVHINVNPALYQMTGFSREELIGVGPPHPYWPKEEYENIKKALQKTLKGEFEDFELIFKRKNGERFPVIVSPSWTKDKQGNVVSYFAMIKDITERKKAEELRKEIKIKTQEIKEVHQLRDHFIADASHELRTPLSVLQTNLDLLSSLGNLKGSFPYKDFKESIEGGKNQVRLLTTIIEELSLLSRGKKPEELREKIKLGAIVQETVEELRPLAEVKDINYIIKILDQDLEVMGDEGMIRKLVRNLVSNAIKYGREKGKVEIILKKQKREAELQVRDNGIGIPQKDQAYIFERFYRTDGGRSKEKGGIGLGLAICKWIVKLHRGKIGVESKYGKGSTFKVFLPLKGSWEDKVGFWDYKIKKSSSK